MTMRTKDDGPVLEVEDLTISLPDGADRDHAVRGLSFEVRAGEIFCVVGESGSGKSVMALAALGLLDPALRIEGGDLRVEGHSIRSLSEAQRLRLRGERIGMIFQEPMTALNPVVRVGRQVEEVFEEHTAMPKAERRAAVEEALRNVNLDPERIASSFPHQLSGGQLQRIMIAMALALKPRLLIADEPTTALDVTTQAQVLRLLKDLQAGTGTGVLFITHDFAVVAEIADRVLVMHRGEAVEAGEARTVLEEPRHDYTRMLIDAVPRGAVAEPGGRSTVPLLKVEGLAKTYTTRGWRRTRTFHALRDVDLEMAEAEILGVVGESGSGKTTLARCVAQLVPADAGRIALAGENISALDGEALRCARAKVQTVFQNPYASLNPRLRVGDTVARGPMNFGADRAEAMRDAREMLERVGLTAAAAERYPGQFSGGQRQRIAMARALVMRPRLLIADEAVSALDVSIQKQIIELMRKVRDFDGVSILFITHDLRVAAELCDRIVVMHDGEVVEGGPAADVMRSPEHDYTRRLLAAMPGRAWLDAAETVRSDT